MRTRRAGRENAPGHRSGLPCWLLLLALASCAPAVPAGPGGDPAGAGGRIAVMGASGGGPGAASGAVGGMSAGMITGAGGQHGAGVDAGSPGLDARNSGGGGSGGLSMGDAGATNLHGSGGSSGGHDAGGAGGNSAGSDASLGPDPLGASARCTSNKSWTSASGGSQDMRPGEACPTCHANFLLAGTIYPTGHEPDDCDGVDGLTTNVVVVVTDAMGVDHTLYPNGVGNFYTSIAIVPPFHAKVVWNGKERAMLPTQTSGSCNSCHTQAGANGAPGRITMPF